MRTSARELEELGQGKHDLGPLLLLLPLPPALLLLSAYHPSAHSEQPAEPCFRPTAHCTAAEEASQPSQALAGSQAVGELEPREAVQ